MFSFLLLRLSVRVKGQNQHLAQIELTEVQLRPRPDETKLLNLHALVSTQLLDYVGELHIDGQVIQHEGLATEAAEE